MFNALKRRQRVPMETMLDVEGLPKERVAYLKDLIMLWKKQDQGTPQETDNDDVKPSDFIVRKSHVLGGEMTRAMAYEED